ncbi:GTP cyclohydrolase II [Methylophilus sp. 3sh_L]|uniref:GTP cyclohydrolase II n=1 Tax=Methylophilus sp. 3sh_L TaxID=3377114 RepID=UPI00398EDCFC
MPLNNLALAQTLSSQRGRLQWKASAHLPTEYGDYRLHAFVDAQSGQEQIALVLGEVSAQSRVLTRVHSECLTGDVFGSQRCDCGEQFKRAQQLIQARGNGIILYLRGHEGRGIGISNKVQAYGLQDTGLDTVAANLALGLPVDQRAYDDAAAMLQHFAVKSIELLSNNPEKSRALTRLGIAVDAVTALEIASNPANADYLATKKHRLGHHLSLVP